LLQSALLAGIGCEKKSQYHDFSFARAGARIAWAGRTTGSLIRFKRWGK
jgi:hypothetical protein